MRQMDVITGMMQREVLHTGLQDPFACLLGKTTEQLRMEADGHLRRSQESAWEMRLDAPTIQVYAGRGARKQVTICTMPTHGTWHPDTSPDPCKLASPRAGKP